MRFPRKDGQGAEDLRKKTGMSINTKSTPKSYDLEFKKQAVQLLNTSGRPLAHIARELGVPSWQLRDWKQRLQPQLAQQPETLEAMRLRLAELERENVQLRHQRDILKKTLGIVSNT